MSNRTNFVSIENWVTIGVAPLPPGWVNVYESDNGGHWVYETPALLLQESTRALQGWDEPGPVGGPEVVRRSREIATDRETRVVYADSDGGCLEPANDAGNYLFSCTRAEYETRQADGRAG